MIGGFDVELLGARNPYDLVEALNYIVRKWPNASVVSCAPYEGHLRALTTILSAIPRKLWDVTELFVYKDEDAFRSWEKDGLTDTNYDDLISITLRPEGVFFVVGDKESASKAIVDGAIREIKYYRNSRCTRCSGSGYEPQPADSMECSLCWGHGSSEWDDY